MKKYPEHADAARPQAGWVERERVVYRVEVFCEDDGRYAAEFVTGDGKTGGMGQYAATPVGALAELCCTLIKVAEDEHAERATPLVDVCQSCQHAAHDHNLRGIGECYASLGPGKGICRCRSYKLAEARSSPVEARPRSAPEREPEDEIDVEALRDALGDAIGYHEGKLAQHGECAAMRMQRVEHWRNVYERSASLLVAESPAGADRPHDFRHLASAMRKMLPPDLLAEVIAHLDPLTPFVAFLRGESAGADRRSAEPVEPKESAVAEATGRITQAPDLLAFVAEYARVSCECDDVPGGCGPCRARALLARIEGGQ